MSVNVSEIREVIETLYPLAYACEWDNSGFQLNLNNNTNRVLVCLDVTPEIIYEAAQLGCWLIVSHHPLLFHPLRMVDTNRYIDRCLVDLVKYGISLYSAHTTADNAPCGINAKLAEIIGLTGIHFIEPLVLNEEPADVKAGVGVIGNLEKSWKIGMILEKLKSKLALETVRLRGALEDEVKRVAVCSGAGGSLVRAAAEDGAQLLITGEVKHNFYVESPVSVMELGHYESEKCFCSMMADGLQRALIDVKYNVTVRVADKMRKPYFDY